MTLLPKKPEKFQSERRAPSSAGGTSRPNTNASRPNTNASRPNTNASRPNTNASRPNTNASRPNIAGERDRSGPSPLGSRRGDFAGGGSRREDFAGGGSRSGNIAGSGSRRDDFAGAVSPRAIQGKPVVAEQRPRPAMAPAPSLTPRRPTRSSDASAFAELGLSSALVAALSEEGYETPTPIQRQCIPTILEGRDLLGSAQTGTGKTAAFMLPILERLGAPKGTIRALVVTPTRELALQIAERATGYGRNLKLGNTVVYGGVSQKRQEEQLRLRPDVLIATPGRLLDLVRQKVVSLRNVEMLVLDEADTMLDMGFIHDVRRILSEVPTNRQTLLFSATLPAPIVELSARFLRDPVRVSVAPQGTTAEGISESVYFVSQTEKRALLEQVLKTEIPGRTLIFSRTKHGANRIASQLEKAGIQAAAIHGNKSQSARVRALNEFREGSNLVLVATDIAARGIDVQDVSLVVNYELPNVPESYVHRIGRTARAGGQGKAIAFCDNSELGCLHAIEKLTQKKIPVAGGSPGAFQKSEASGSERSTGPRGSNGGSTGQRQAGRNGQNGRRPFRR